MSWRNAPTVNPQADAPKWASAPPVDHHPAGSGQAADTRPDSTMLEGIIDAFTQGASFGFGDELTGLEAALLGKTPSGKWFDYSHPFRDRYKAARDAERAQQDRFREEHPVAAYGTMVAGTIPTAMILGPEAAVGDSMSAGAIPAAVTPGLDVAVGGSLAKAIGTGALQGGLFGAGEAEGDLSDRAVGALTGALTGGGTSAVMTPIAKVAAGNLARDLMTRRAARDVGLSRPAYEMMQRVSKADEAATGLGAENIAKAGQNAMIVDAGPSSLSLLDTVMQRGGKALTTAGSNIRSRVAQASKDVAKTLDDILGKPQGIKSAATNIAKSTSAGRSEAYRRAYDSAINYASPDGRRIEEVVGRVPARILNKAINKANDYMTSIGEHNKQILANIADDGSVTFHEMPNVQQLDELKKALGTMGRENVDRFGRQTYDGIMLSRLSRELRDAIADAAPSYREAIRKGFDKIEMDNALKLGRDMLRPSVTREDVTMALNGMSDAARQKAKAGLRSYIDDMLANVKTVMSDPNVDARETRKILQDLSSRASREKMQALLGKSDAENLYKVIDWAQKAFNVRSGLARNSATFVRQEANKMLSDLSKSDVIDQLRSGEFSAAARDALRKVTGMGEAEIQRVIDNHANELAQFLTGPRGGDAVEKLKLLSKMPTRINQSGRRVQSMAKQLMTPVPAISGGLAGRLATEKKR